MSTLMDLRNVIKSSIERKIEASVKSYSGGQAKDYGAYKYGCGVTQGLVRALDTVDEAFNMLLNEEDDGK